MRHIDGKAWTYIAAVLAAAPVVVLASLFGPAPRPATAPPTSGPTTTAPATASTEGPASTARTRAPAAPAPVAPPSTTRLPAHDGVIEDAGYLVACARTATA